MTQGIWEYISGSKSIGLASDYDMSYPGGSEGFSMAIDSNDCLYVFGGLGFRGGNNGILYHLVDYRLS